VAQRKASLPLRILDRLEEWLIASLIAAATTLIFLAVLHRYGSHLSINWAKSLEAHGVPFLPAVLTAIYEWISGIDVSWAQELCIFMFIWMAKFGAAYGVRTGIHVGVDVLVNLLPPDKRKRVILFAIACGALFTGLIAAFGYSFVIKMYATGQQSYDLEWPMWAIYLAIPLGSGLMCFRFLQVAWWYYWTGTLPHHWLVRGALGGRCRESFCGRTWPDSRRVRAGVSVMPSSSWSRSKAMEVLFLWRLVHRRWICTRRFRNGAQS